MTRMLRQERNPLIPTGLSNFAHKISLFESGFSPFMQNRTNEVRKNVFVLYFSCERQLSLEQLVKSVENFVMQAAFAPVQQAPRGGDLFCPENVSSTLVLDIPVPIALGRGDPSSLNPLLCGQIGTDVPRCTLVCCLIFMCNQRGCGTSPNRRRMAWVVSWGPNQPES